MTPTTREIVMRRFGRRHDQPCSRPEVLTCAQWQCQWANECQAPKLPAAIVIPFAPKEPTDG